jgi:hypothetical protein
MAFIVIYGAGHRGEVRHRGSDHAQPLALVDLATDQLPADRHSLTSCHDDFVERGRVGAQGEVSGSLQSSA